MSAGLPAGIGFASLPHVIDAQTYLLGTNEGPGSGIFRTTDSGATWTQVHAGPVSGQPLVAADGSLMWLIRSGGGIVRSTDGGVTWTELPSGAIDRNAEDLVQLPDGRIAALGGGTIVASADGGATWTSIGAALPYPPSGLAYAPLRQAFYIWKFDCRLLDRQSHPARRDHAPRLPRCLTSGSESLQVCRNERRGRPAPRGAGCHRFSIDLIGVAQRGWLGPCPSPTLQPVPIAG